MRIAHLSYKISVVLCLKINRQWAIVLLTVGQGAVLDTHGIRGSPRPVGAYRDVLLHVSILPAAVHGAGTL